MTINKEMLKEDCKYEDNYYSDYLLSRWEFDVEYQEEEKENGIVEGTGFWVKITLPDNIFNSEKFILENMKGNWFEEEIKDKINEHYNKSYKIEIEDITIIKNVIEVEAIVVI